MAFVKRTGVIIWTGDIGQGDGKNEVESRISSQTSAATFQVFAAAIEPYSKTNLSYYLNTVVYSQTVGAPGTGTNIDKKGVIYFRDPDTLEVLNFQYPDPIAADVEVTPWGKRIKDSAVIAITALLSTMAGVSYKPLYGIYYQRA